MNMYCHYVNDKIAGRVLIPGCWGAVIHGKYACTCDRTSAKKELEERVSKLEKIIAEMKRTICTIQGCRSRIVGSGLCPYHYAEYLDKKDNGTNSKKAKSS